MLQRPNPESFAPVDLADDYERVRGAIEFMTKAARRQPEVEEIYCDDETFSELVERASNEKRLRRG